MEPTDAPAPSDDALARALPAPRRLVVVSNRLPFVARPAGRGWAFERTVGGLVTGIESFVRSGKGPPEVVWVGWPGRAVPASRAASLRTEARARHGLVPVLLPSEVAEGYYDGLCNRALWPLLHSAPTRVHLEEPWWDAYRAANEAFRDAVLGELRDGDLVWVHDFHLMALPALLREARPDVALAWFLHVPFPAYEILRVLPDAWTRALLEGVLGADVVGLHTHDYARHFLRAARRVLGADATAGRLDVAGRPVRVDAFPLGVDFPLHDTAAQRPEVVAERARLRAAFGDARVVLSVDRLDPSKGIPQRLAAYERLLERRPDLHGRVVLALVGVPSREDVDAYRRLRAQVEETVGRVNGRFGRFGWVPVHAQMRAVGPDELAALYLVADVALVTPLRDGMNLVAKEFLATRHDGEGVLVLSDTAGAARELGEALLVNPYHPAGVADALERALGTAPEARRAASEPMRERLRRYDAARWGSEQVEAVMAARGEGRRLEARLAAPADLAGIVARFSAARHRVLLLDYDGTLVPLVESPRAAVPDAALRATLRALATVPDTSVVVVSGRDATTLSAWLGDLPVELVAEHGAQRRPVGGAWTDLASRDTAWHASVRPVLDVFADRLPGALVEAKTFGLAWHHRAADPELGPLRARELVETLEGLRLPPHLRVARGRDLVEVRPAAVTKAAALPALDDPTGTFLLAVGDDATDEDLFAALPPQGLAIRVGTADSRAALHVRDVGDVRRLLARLVAAGAAEGVP